MQWLKEFAGKVRFWRTGARFDDQLADEIRFHLETRAAELAAGGLPPREARAQARREFGPALRVHEESRAAWQWRWCEDLLSDLRYAGRTFRQSPGFAAAAVLLLALGIGANTTIFSLTMEFLFSNPSCRDGARLTYVLFGGNSHSYIDVYRFLADSRAFEGVAGSNEETESNWRNGASTERVWTINATSNFFDLVGVPVALGRPIHAGESNEVVLNYPFWKGKLGGSADVIGRKLVLDGDVYTVVGVLPDDHRTLTGFGLSPDLYKTFRNPVFPLALYIRLPAGMSRAEALARLKQLAQQLDRVYPQRDFKQAEQLEMRPVAGIERLRSVSMVPFTAFFGMLLMLAGLVLLIACANVASLLLARAASRAQELSIRQAIGAGRGRLVRQLLAESLLLAGLGTLAGLALNLALGRLMNALRLSLPIPLRLHVEPDWRLLGYAAALALLSAVLCGVLPAWKATRRDLHGSLKIEQRQPGGRARLQKLLVTGQIAASVLLLTVSFLFLRNLLSAARLNPGFDVRHTVWAYMRLAPERYPARQPIEAAVRQSLEKLRRLPGVESAATLRIVPLNDNWHSTTTVRVDDSPTTETVSFHENEVGPDYFETMGIPLLAGREFRATDNSHAPAVVILNRTLARRLFGDRNAVGHSIQAHFGPRLTVAGVVADSHYFTLGESNTAALYDCYFQATGVIVNLNFMVRSALPSASLAQEITRALHAVDPTAALEVKPMAHAMAFALLPSQVGAALLGSMGALALLLAAVGLYGLLIYTVSRRLREFGLRIALGAAPGAVIRLVLVDCWWMLAAGLASGLGLAFLATPPLAAFLVPAVHAHDLAAFSLAGITLSLVATLASIVPAQRAIRVDPATALRYE